MKKSDTLYAITGQSLDYGAPIYLTKEHSWSKDFNNPALFPNKQEAEKVLDIVNKESKNHSQKVLDPYLIEIVDNLKKAIPLHMRENIRMNGPTVSFVYSLLLFFLPTVL